MHSGSGTGARTDACFEVSLGVKAKLGAASPEQGARRTRGRCRSWSRPGASPTAPATPSSPSANAPASSSAPRCAHQTYCSKEQLCGTIDHFSTPGHCASPCWVVVRMLPAKPGQGVATPQGLFDACMTWRFLPMPRSRRATRRCALSQTSTWARCWMPRCVAPNQACLPLSLLIQCTLHNCFNLRLHVLVEQGGVWLGRLMSAEPRKVAMLRRRARRTQRAQSTRG